MRFTYRNGIKIPIDERGNEITKSFLSSRTNASAAFHEAPTMMMPHYMDPTAPSRGYPIASGSSSSQVTPRNTPLKSVYTGAGGAASTRNHGARLQSEPLLLPNRYTPRAPEPILTNFAIYRHWVLIVALMYSTSLGTSVSGLFRQKNMAKYLVYSVNQSASDLIAVLYELEL